MLVTIAGGLGSGKTLLATVIAYYSKLDVYSNYQISFTHKKAQPFDLGKFIRAEYENCLIILDEAYTYLESRVSGSETNRIMSYILFQSRKKNVQLYLTCQLLSSIDRRYRELSDIFIIADRYRLDFHYIIFHPSGNSEIFMNYDKMSNFFQFYNTNEVIGTTNTKLLFDIQDSAGKKEEIENFAHEIKEYYESEGSKRVTKSMINLYITTHNHIPSFLSDGIYTQLKLEKEKEESKKKTIVKRKNRKNARN